MTAFLTQLSWCLPLYGLAGAVLTLPLSIGVVRRTGPRLVAYINIVLTILAMAHGWVVLQGLWGQPPQTLILPWFQVPGLDLSLALDISPVSIAAVEVVTGLSLLAQIFGIGYLDKDWAVARFYALMGFFEAAITGVALSDSLFLSYALLEMLTLSTYLLVGFWYAQPLAMTAARDAFWTKRVGDSLLLMGLVALAAMSGQVNFADLAVWVQTADLSPATATLLGLALIAGPAGKCAQFPLHLWLDEAMEGPSPASALRNSVVVGAGAYVLIKVEPVLLLSPVVLNTLVVIGAVTAVGASLVAIAQVDIKRTFSHSTSAYLGLVFVAVGLERADVALLFLLTHGLAKALMFMSVGAISYTTNTQDVRELGGLGRRLPATTLSYLIGLAGTVALPPLGTAWAMSDWLAGVWDISPLLGGILFVVNGLTIFNGVRVFSLVFRGPTQPKTRRSPEVGWWMALPMLSLAIIVLLLPIMLVPSGVPLDWRLWLDLPMVLLLASTVVGAGAGWVIYPQGKRAQPVQLPWPALQDLFAYDFYIDRLYRLTIVLVINRLSRVSAWFDRQLVDGAVNLVGFAALFGGEGLKYSVPGQTQLYLLSILLSLGLLGVIWRWSLL